MTDWGQRSEQLQVCQVLVASSKLSQNWIICKFKTETKGVSSCNFVRFSQNWMFPPPFPSFQMTVSSSSSQSLSFSILPFKTYFLDSDSVSDLLFAKQHLLEYNMCGPTDVWSELRIYLAFCKECQASCSSFLLKNQNHSKMLKSICWLQVCPSGTFVVQVSICKTHLIDLLQSREPAKTWHSAKSRKPTFNEQ